MQEDARPRQNEAQRNEGAGGKGREDTPPRTQRPGKIVVVEEEAAALQDNEILQAAAAAQAIPNKEKTESPHDSEKDKNSIARLKETPRMPCLSAQGTRGGRRREHSKGTVGENRGLAQTSAERAEDEATGGGTRAGQNKARRVAGGKRKCQKSPSKTRRRPRKQRTS